MASLKAASPSARIERSWVVYLSQENEEHDRCVDLFVRPDGSFGFEEFRRDVEDQGRWTQVAYYSGASFRSREAALTAARAAITWLRDMGPERDETAST